MKIRIVCSLVLSMNWLAAQAGLFQSNVDVISVPGNFNEWNLGANYLMPYGDHQWTGQFRFIGENYDNPLDPFRKFKFAANRSFDVAWGEIDQGLYYLPMLATAETNGTDIFIDMDGSNPVNWQFVRVFFNELSGSYSLIGVDAGTSLYGQHLLNSSSEALMEGVREFKVMGDKTFALLNNGNLVTGRVDCAANYNFWGADRKSTPGGIDSLNIAVNEHALAVVSKPGNQTLSFRVSTNGGNTFASPVTENFSSIVGTYRMLGRGTNEFLLVVELWQEKKLEVLYSANNGASFSRVHAVTGGVNSVYLEDLDAGTSGFYLAYAIEGSGAKETGIAFSGDGGSGWGHQILSTSTNALFRDVLVSASYPNIALYYDKGTSEYVFLRQSGSDWTEYHRITYGWEARDLQIGEENGTLYIAIQDAYISESFGNPLHVWRSLDGGDEWIPYDLIEPYSMIKGIGSRLFFATSYQLFITKDALWMGNDPGHTIREVFAPYSGLFIDPPGMAVAVGTSPGWLFMTITQLVAGAHYTVQSSSDMTNWTNTAAFLATNTIYQVESNATDAVLFLRTTAVMSNSGTRLTVTSESWPAGTLLDAQVRYSLDNWATTNAVDMDRVTVIGANDIWSHITGTLTPGQTIRYYITGDGRGCSTFREPAAGDYSSEIPSFE